MHLTKNALSEMTCAKVLNRARKTQNLFCIESTIGIYQNFMYMTTKHPTTTANQNPIHFHQGYRRVSSAFSGTETDN